MANPSDVTYSIIKETTAGTLPGTGTLLGLDYIPGTMPVYRADGITSPTLKANRASAGSRRVNYRVEGGFNVHFCRDAAVELLLESALSGAWATNVLKASNADTSFSIEEKMIEGAGSLYQRFLGCQVSSFSLSCPFDSNAEATFDIIGMDRDQETTASSLGSATAAGTKTKLTGLDVSNVTIAGLTATYTSLDLSVTHNRETQGQFGSAAARGIGTSGNREVTLTLKGYRADFTPESIIGDDPIAVSFTMGSGVNGYTFSLPAAYGSLPENEMDASKALFTVTFTAAYDTTAATDFQITRLT